MSSTSCTMCLLIVPGLKCSVRVGSPVLHSTAAAPTFNYHLMPIQYTYTSSFACSASFVDSSLGVLVKNGKFSMCDGSRTMIKIFSFFFVLIFLSIANLVSTL